MIIDGEPVEAGPGDIVVITPEIKDFAEDPDALEGAYFRELDHFRMTLEGTGNVDRKAAQRNLDMLAEMDERGELEGFFMSLVGRDQANAQPAEPPTGQPAQPGQAQAGGMI